MGTIIHETEEFEVLSDVQTVAGADLVIVPTPTGLYKIEARGKGNPPSITEETFTNLPHAKEALRRFKTTVAPLVNKKKTMQEGIDRRNAEAEAKGK